jgi:uncharacterized membrane protein
MWPMILAAMTGCLASGNDPEWQLCRSSTGVILQVGNQPPQRLEPGTWRDTPRGREWALRGQSGTVSLVAIFGRCRSNERWKRARENSRLVVLSLPDGRVLRGCMTERAAVYPG